jgi:hypothetical protein
LPSPELEAAGTFFVETVPRQLISVGPTGWSKTLIPATSAETTDPAFGFRGETRAAPARASSLISTVTEDALFPGFGSVARWAAASSTLLTGR